MQEIAEDTSCTLFFKNISATSLDWEASQTLVSPFWEKKKKLTVFLLSLWSNTGNDWHLSALALGQWLASSIVVIQRLSPDGVPWEELGPTAGSLPLSRSETHL